MPFPDEIVRYISEFLDLVSVLNLSLVSKRFRNVVLNVKLLIRQLNALGIDAKTEKDLNHVKMYSNYYFIKHGRTDLHLEQELPQFSLLYLDTSFDDEWGSMFLPDSHVDPLEGIRCRLGSEDVVFSTNVKRGNYTLILCESEKVQDVLPLSNKAGCFVEVARLYFYKKGSIRCRMVHRVL